MSHELSNGTIEENDEHLFDEMRFISEFEDKARIILHPKIFSYIACGADNQVTLKNNTAAFERYTIQPRYFQDTFNVDLSTTLFDGQKVSCPFGIAPSCCHAKVHKNAELETVKAAVRAGVPMIVSAVSNRSYEEIESMALKTLISEHSPDDSKVPILWFQIKIFKDRSKTIQMIRRGEKCGFSALVIGVDWCVVGKRQCGEWSQVMEVCSPDFARFPNFPEDVVDVFSNPEKFLAPLNWSTIDWLKSVTNLPIIFKGVLNPKFAKEACQHGVAGIIVSNHGGRQLDSLPATIDVLPEIVKAVDEKCDIYLDGGIRSGNSAFKALALGAKAVFLGRPILYGLANGGAKGAGRVLEILDEELRIAMSLAGFRTLKDLQNADYDVDMFGAYTKILRDFDYHTAFWREPLGGAPQTCNRKVEKRSVYFVLIEQCLLSLPNGSLHHISRTL